MAEPLGVVILGAGGHGQVVADLLLAATPTSGVRPLGFLDDDSRLVGQERVGLPVLGPTAALDQVPHDAAIIGIGDNRVRRLLFERLVARCERLIVACHPRAVVAQGVAVGAGTVVCAGVVVNTGSRIGANAILNTGCTVDHHNVLGDHVHIAPGAHLGGEVTIGDGALVGMGALILPGRRVGASCVVGAGAVVTRDLPDGVVAVGMPARIVRQAT